MKRIAMCIALIVAVGCEDEQLEWDGFEEDYGMEEAEYRQPAKPPTISLSNLSQNPPFTFTCGTANLNFDIDLTNTGSAATPPFALLAEELTASGPLLPAGVAVQASVAANTTVSINNENIEVYTGPCDLVPCPSDTKLYQLRAAGSDLANNGQAVIGTLSLTRDCGRVNDATQMQGP